MLQYCKVFSGTRSQISSEICPKVARRFTHSASGATSNEILKTSCAAYAVYVNVSQETRRANASVHDQNDGVINFTISLLSELCNSKLPRVPNNPYDSTGMLMSTKALYLSIIDQKFCKSNLFCRFRTGDSYSCFSQATRGPRFCFRTRVSYSSTMLGPRPERDPRSTYPKTQDPHSACFKT